MSISPTSRLEGSGEIRAIRTDSMNSNHSQLRKGAFNPLNPLVGYIFSAISEQQRTKCEEAVWDFMQKERLIQWLMEVKQP